MITQETNASTPLYGLSTDQKPVGPTVANGTFYIYIDRVGTDQNKLACYDAENGKWYPEESGGTGA